MNAFWGTWGPWISGGGFVGFMALLLSYMARPSSQTIADLQANLLRIEEQNAKDKEEMKREHATEMTTVRSEIGEARREIGALRESNFHMRVVFTALSVQYNTVRQELLKRDPNVQILTIKEIVDESHVPLQSVIMFDPAQIGFLWPDRQSPPPPSP